MACFWSARRKKKQKKSVRYSVGLSDAGLMVMLVYPSFILTLHQRNFHYCIPHSSIANSWKKITKRLSYRIWMFIP